MQVVYDPGHVLHDPATEVQYGVPMPMYEVPARVESIRAALLADDNFSFTDPAGHGLEPVTDYHHGNGTQQIFYHRADVLYVSLHADPDRAFPYFIGWADERGSGPGEGFTLNLPLPAGCTNDRYLAALDTALERIAEHDAAVLVVSLGLDTYGQDPIADFALSTDVYHEVGRRVAGLGAPTLVLQEGGYFVPKLGENARTWLRDLLGSPLDLRATPG
jgi:acetoin utilization deacetylase AcuC-like enzyme